MRGKLLVYLLLRYPPYIVLRHGDFGRGLLCDILRRIADGRDLGHDITLREVICRFNFTHGVQRLRNLFESVLHMTRELFGREFVVDHLQSA